MASLTSIPLELLVHISSYLSTPDLGSLRRTCKLIEKSLYEWFSKEFFSKKQFMLSQQSLQTLIDISKHAALSKKVTHVIIATDQFSETNVRFNNKDSCERYRQGYVDQFTLKNTGIDREMLTEAFRNLPNLGTVGIRDFNAPSRLRDGSDAYWTSYGSTTVFRETRLRLQLTGPGAPFVHEDVQAHFVSHAFSTVIYALGKAGCTPPAIEILLRQHSSGLPDHAFNILDFALPAVKPVLQGLKSILLSLNLQVKPAYRYDGRTPDDQDAGVFLQRFLTRTPNLTHLRLNFQKHQQNENETFLRWLGKTSPSASAGSITASPSARISTAQTVTFSHLQRIDFGMLTVSPALLQAVLTKFAATLQGLSLWSMTLALAGPLPDPDSNRSLWSILFAKLAELPQLDLNYVMVGRINEQYGLSPQLQVDFKAQKPNRNNLIDDDQGGDEQGPGPLETMAEYTGKDGKTFLKALVERVHVHWPAPVVIEDFSEGASDDDEEMLDEDADEPEEEDDEEDDED
ncbi:hypothetical protein BU26DRAFT_523530 [Trematosphaeria pertusa]|uniref:F-box domain-containing protein n=1 Tax=Trematosphaeria pertusa TaxID=390896 RepID=A0A6A6I0L7_9PLEO|nr:uncharacterized protein BU26DRAFT_523530 [Trematosphaeria pertusa]KAF2243985.1 hypothetical protein BU26DRAFT_523530 [Trematosphaeria pertusa]